MALGQFKFTKDQQKAYDKIMSGIDTFVTGGAGTGKSKVAMKVISELEAQGRNVVVSAPTGIAAVGIGGTTIHKAFEFSKGPCITEKSLNLTVHATKLIRMADVVIIDEISMCRMDMMDAVCASIIKAEKKESRKKQLVVFGDFCQLPPVLVDGSGERELLEEYYGKSIGAAFAFQARGWKERHFTPVILDEVVRQGNEGFIHALNAIRMGDPSAIKYFNTYASFDSDNAAIKLYARNDDVDNANKEELGRLPGAMEVFSPVCYGDHSVIPNDMNPVYLKKGARIIVTTNMGESVSFSKMSALHNGAIGIVTDLFSDSLEPKNDYVVVSLADGGHYFIYRQMQDIYKHYIDNDGHIRRKVACNISYMPVKLAYAMTVHRSQGQTYNSIVLDPSCHTSGQLYVGLSRVRTIEGLHLTRKITPRDVYLAPTVKEFYAHLNEPEYVPSWQRDFVVGNRSKSIRQEGFSTVNRKNIMLPLENFCNTTETQKCISYDGVRERYYCEGDISEDEVRDALVQELADDVGDNSYGTEFVNALNEDSIPSVRDSLVERSNGGLKKNEDLSVKESAFKIEIEPIHKENINYEKKEVASEKSAVRAFKRGRRKRFPTESKVCRVPVEIYEEVSSMIELICPKTGINFDELQKFKSTLREMCRLDI